MIATQQLFTKGYIVNIENKSNLSTLHDKLSLKNLIVIATWQTSREDIFTLNIIIT